MPDLFDTLTRRGDPHTSYAAAATIVPKLHKLLREVYLVVARSMPRGITAWEVEAHFDDHGSTYRTRLSELANTKNWMVNHYSCGALIRDSGRTRTIKGRSRIIWEIVPEGKDK